MPLTRYWPICCQPWCKAGDGHPNQRLPDDTAPRVFIGYNEAPGRPATLGGARRLAQAILDPVDGVQD